MSIDVKGNVQNRRKEYESGKYFLVIYTYYMYKYHESNKDITHFLINNSFFLVRPWVAQAREPSQVSSCLGGCQQINSLLKSFE